MRVLALFGLTLILTLLLSGCGGGSSLQAPPDNGGNEEPASGGGDNDGKFPIDDETDIARASACFVG